ncbi:TRAP transporter small permease [Aurantimonas sp. HBX-1]|uniref:TRAP transporter small permease n=1 Tax=Aurantimonas sp. HBX-1 TaxID=2906072 RepID=UPI001F362F00|nr:TRAP transporter small permease [Aurantimonas sp. HBX-1]UIJ73398.1 TRAP transporter small permease [Aurantimonas sp. HBX-1]
MIVRDSLRKGVDAVNIGASWICHALLVVITGVICMQVFLRFALNRPTSWSEEVALLCLIWFGLLAIAIGIRRHEHVAISFLRDMLPSRLAVGLDYMAQGAMAVFMLAVVYYGQDLLALAGHQVLPASGLPKQWLYLPTIAGGLLGCLNAIANIVLRDVGDPNFSVEGLHAD